MRQVEAVEILRQVWLQQFYVEKGALQFRSAADCSPQSQVINSPYDPDAKRGNKRTTIWIGYKVHLSETCDEDTPHIITHVETTPTSSKDYQIIDSLHQNLADA